MKHSSSALLEGRIYNPITRNLLSTTCLNSSPPLELHISIFQELSNCSKKKKQSWHDLQQLSRALKDPGWSSMRDLLRQTSEKEMSATMLSALYDIDMLYKVKYISPL